MKNQTLTFGEMNLVLFCSHKNRKLKVKLNELELANEGNIYSVLNKLLEYIYFYISTKLLYKLSLLVCKTMKIFSVSLNKVFTETATEGFL